MVIITQWNRPQKATHFSSLLPTATLETPEVSFRAFKSFWSPAWLDILWSDFHCDQTWCAGDTHTKLAEQPLCKAFSRQESVQRLTANNTWLPWKGNKYPLWKGSSSQERWCYCDNIKSLQGIKLSSISPCLLPLIYVVLEWLHFGTFFFFSWVTEVH